MWYNALIMVPPLLVAVILHEIAHGYVAEKLGDPTARTLGRINLNPLVHIDPFLTILLPGALILAGSPIVFGGAKPVPVDPRYFKDPRRGMLWVAIAGPAVNFVLATLSYGLYWLSFWFIDMISPPLWLAALLLQWCMYSVVINIVLGVFNLVPIPPLDGGRIAVGLLPRDLALRYARVERFGFIIVVALLMMGGFDYLVLPVVKFLMPSFGA